MDLRYFEGIISALLTPSEKLYEKIGELIEFNLKHGVRGFFVLGTAGEGVKLAPETRKQVAEAAVQQAGSRSLVIVHVGASDMETVKQLTKHASKIGAHAVSAVAPFYYRYDADSLVSFYRSLEEVSSVPVLVYNNPGRQGYTIPFDGIVKILESMRETSGLKESSGDHEMLLRLLHHFKTSKFLASGGDSLIAYSFIIGYRAHVSALASIYPDIVVKISQYVRDGRLDDAFMLQSKLNHVREVLKKIGPDTASSRYALMLRGVDVGGPFPPTRGLTPDEKKTLEKLLPKEEEIKV